MLRLAAPLFAALLLTATLATPASALWSHDPAVGLVLSPPAYAGGLATLPDGSGGYFLVWTDSRNTPNISDLFAQHLSAAGVPLWASNGVPVCVHTLQKQAPAMISDGSGGLIIGWTDFRNGAANPDIFAQRLNAAGAPQWAINGIDFCGNAAGAYGPVMATDFAGGAFLAWADDRTPRKTYMQRVNGAGVAQWTADGILIANAAGSQAQQQILSTLSGSGPIATVVWQDSRNFATTGYDLYAQTVGPTGTLFNGATGFLICNAAGSQDNPHVAQDASAIVYLEWEDSRGANPQIYGQRYTFGFSGTYWAANGVALAPSSGKQSNAMMAADNSGGMYVTFSDSRLLGSFEYDIYAQHVGLAAQPLWGTGGVVLQSDLGFQAAGALLVNGSSGIAVAWTDQSVGGADVRVQQLSANGLAQWTAGGVALGGPGTDGGPQLLSDSNGGVVVFFSYAPITTGNVLAAHGIDRWGKLGADPVMAGVRDVPNDNGGQVRVSWFASALDTDLNDASIRSYYVYRAMSAAPAAAALRAGRTAVDASAAGAAPDPAALLVTRTGANAFFWEQVASEPAMHLATYSHVCATTSDSMAASNPRTAFMIYAAGAGTAFWTSAPDSGYSVDNLPPVQPAPFTGQYGVGSTRLHWNPNHEADLAGYQLYRGPNAGFALDTSHLLAAVPDTGYTDAAGAPYVYKLVAVDAHGNRSPVATLIPSGTLAVGDAAPRALAFAAPAPNPLRAGAVTTLRFALPVAEHVRLALMSVDGREAAVLANGAFAAGEHAIAFSGRDATGGAFAPGLYFARLVTHSGERTQRVVIVR
jgi:hypothetical protein